MSTVAAMALAASSPSPSSSHRTTANTDQPNKQINQHQDSNGKKTQFYRFCGSAAGLQVPLRNTTAQHTCLTVQLSQSSQGQYKIQPNIAEP